MAKLTTQIFGRELKASLAINLAKYSRTYPNVEPEEGQSDTVGHAYRRQEPDFWWWGTFILDVADYLLRCLSLVHLSLDPFVKTAFLQGAIETNQELYVPVKAGLGEGCQVAKHVVPLASAYPVGVKATVKPVEAILGIN